MRTQPPYPRGADDLQLRTVLTIGDTANVTPEAWALAARQAVTGGLTHLAPDTLLVPVVADGELFEIRLGDLMQPDAHADDIADALRACLAAAAAHAGPMWALIAAAERLMRAPAATVPTTEGSTHR